MTTFKEVVEYYTGSIVSGSLLNQYNGEFPEKVLHHKLMKHSGNPRKSAIYIKSYMTDFGYPSERIIDKAKKLGIVYNKRGIGYPHKDGTYHYF